MVWSLYNYHKVRYIRDLIVITKFVISREVRYIGRFVRYRELVIL